MLLHSLHVIVARERQCNSVSDECPISESFYGYAPSYPPNAILLAIFGLAFIVHTAQGVYYRTWGTLIAFSLGCLSEVIGRSKFTSWQLCMWLIFFNRRIQRANYDASQCLWS